jgi:para-nitrobenzyl esterase
VALAFGMVSASASAEQGQPKAQPVKVSAAASANQGQPAAQPNGQCATGTLVQTDKGPVCGITATGVKEWLGVPFAAPPVGRLRWEPPQPHQPWQTPWQALESSNVCPQVYNAEESLPSTDEDCLYLDIVTPTNAGNGPLPVMFHIYGGGYLQGGNALFSGVQLSTAAKAIVVGVNYRLGVLGFLASHLLGAHSGDYGLEDQQAGLQWVKRNIAAFGGDPNNVTVFGESAGGGSTCDQIASPTAAGLFQKAITSSGEWVPTKGGPPIVTNGHPSGCNGELLNEAQADQADAPYVASLGCSTVACLRNVPVRDLLATQFGSTQPVIAEVVNGRTLTTSPRDAFATGSVNKVRTIIGVQEDENLYGSAQTADQYQALLQAHYGSHSQDVLNQYPLDRYPSPFVAARKVSTDSASICPDLVNAEHLAQAVPTYAYLGENTDAPIVQAQDQTDPLGSFHGATDFAYPDFSYLNPFNHTPLDANQQALRDQVLAEYGAFAHTGDPTANGSPAWPQFTSGNPAVMTWQPGADSEVLPESVISTIHECGFWQSIAAQS